MLKTISAMLITSAALALPAHAVIGEWEVFEKWAVQADTDSTACEAYSPYDNGFTLSLMNYGNAWLFGIIGYDVTPGMEYGTKIEFSTGDIFNGSMDALSEELLAIKVDDTFIEIAAKAHWIEIDDQIRFELDGSAQAIKATYECQRMLASVATLPKPSEAGPSTAAPTFKWGA